MPNWCHNKLTISGEPELVEECVRGVAGPERAEPEEGAEAEPVAIETAYQPLDFNRIAPIPEELLVEGAVDAARGKELRRRYGAADWYDWVLINWGTKWNANFEGIPAAIGAESAKLPRRRRPIVEPGRAFYAFETAWSPPVPVLSTLARRYSKLRLELIWGEPGSAGAGRVRWRDGELISDEELPIDAALTPEELWF